MILNNKTFLFIYFIKRSNKTRIVIICEAGENSMLFHHLVYYIVKVSDTRSSLRYEAEFNYWKMRSLCLERMLTIFAITTKRVRIKIKDKLLSNHNFNVIN